MHKGSQILLQQNFFFFKKGQTANKFPLKPAIVLIISKFFSTIWETMSGLQSAGGPVVSTHASQREEGTSLCGVCMFSLSKHGTPACYHSPKKTCYEIFNELTSFYVNSRRTKKVTNVFKLMTNKTGHTITVLVKKK